MARRQFDCLLAVLLLVPSGLFADTLRGVVRDEQGQPVANARIDVATAAPKVGPGIFCPSCYLDCKKWTRTNEEGQFEIEGLDPRLKFRILSTAAGKQTRMSKLIDPATESATLVLPDFPQDVPAHRILRGTVVNQQGTPIPGALIEPYGAKTKEKRWWGPVDAQAAVSDDRGHFQMLLDGDFQGVDLTVVADGYAGTRVELLLPGHDEHEIQVPTGASVTGQLVWKGQPVAGHQIAVVQTDRSAQRHFIKSVLAVTDRAGRFQFRALPASQQYAIFSPVGGSSDDSDPESRPLVLSTKTFLVPGDDESRDLGKLELQQGFTFSGCLERNDGGEIPAGTKLIVQRDPAWDLIEAITQQDGQFSISGLPPETYEISIRLKGTRIDSNRSRFQTMSPNSFGLRLVKSLENVVVPLAPEPAEPNANTVDVAGTDLSKSEAQDETVELAPSVSKTGGGARPATRLTDEPVPENGPTLSVRGTVVSSRGERIDGATVILRARINGEQYSMGLLHNRDILARTSSDKNGRFLLSRIPIPLRLRRSIVDLQSDRGGAQIVAFADGYSIAVLDVESADDKTPLRIVLSNEAPIHGIVRDQEGKGIPGARIELYGTTTATTQMDHMLNSIGDVNLSMSEVDRVSLTDEAGRFTIKHAPVNRRVLVSCEAPYFKREIFAIDTTTGRSSLQLSSLTSLNRQIPVHSVSPDIKLEREKSIQVRIVDQQNQPVGDGAVHIYDAKSRFFWKAISNPANTVVFPDVVNGPCSLVYASDPLDARLGMTVKREFKTGEDIELMLPESRSVKGRIISLETGAPIVGVLLGLVQNGSVTDGERAISEAVSRANGEFQIEAVKGKSFLQVRSTVYGYFDDRLMAGNAENHGFEVDVPETGNAPEVVVKLSPGLVIEGTVVSAVGQPIAGAFVRADQLQGQNLSDAVRTDAQGKFRLAGLALTAQTIVTAGADGIGARTIIDAPARQNHDGFRRESVRLTLQSGIQFAGKVLKGGQPQAGVKMELLRSLPGKQNWRLPFVTAVTDAEGRYVVDGLEPGDGYEFKIVTRDRLVDPNWTHQSPYVQTVPTDAIGVIELPDVNLLTARQTLSGQVVDPDGNPVAGITVSCQMKNGMSLSRRDNAPPPWTETDQHGAFDLQELPDGELELMAYKANPAGGLIKNPVRTKPGRNQSDVRIVFDPQLFSGVEDLDMPGL